ncbi:MAG: nucleotidyltransferase [Caldilineaceae bacterium SB0661_bin_32]|uniref:Nucleotidyltransferase n=1 Tax=Caldilineaceae bacterium SB0661_bin_32 TaxID=2605255 RepID=A0A6B1D8F2_9CHLR|nr:nucleotidyltransferase [Caldilineaceae bacterium SB0661_bin_32]
MVLCHNHSDLFRVSLKEAVELAGRRQLSRLEAQGLIQCFEYTHELAWKTLKDFLEARGVRELYGSRDSTRAAFVANLIENGETWMEMIQSRNLTTHTYNEATAAQIVAAILAKYFVEFQKLQARLARLKHGESS